MQDLVAKNFKHSTRQMQNADPISTLAHTSPILNLTWVGPLDIDNIDYVPGSEGRCRTIIAMSQHDITIPAAITTLFYRDLDFPTKPTQILTEYL